MKPTPKALCDATGISPSYASMILSDADDPDKRRTPSRSLAIFIFRQLGWKHPLIADLSEEQMATLEEIDPYRRREAA